MPRLHNKDYMDEDVAYLVGLILVRGTFYEEKDIKRLIIEFPYKSLEAKGIEMSYNQESALELFVNRIRDRINELLEVNVNVENLRNQVVLNAIFTKNTMSWRNLQLIVEGKKHYSKFCLNPMFYDVENSIKKELIRGIADATGFIRPSNAYFGRHRIYLEINNANWHIPIQICKLLQETGVGVQLIQWGHPNVREPNEIDVKPENSTWAREHQIKIFVEEFESVGFYASHKQKILEELIKFNKTNFDTSHKKCNPLQKGVRQIKPTHPCEGHEKIPLEVRNKHFNAYWELCRALGCTQGVPSPQLELDFEEDLITEKEENG